MKLKKEFRNFSCEKRSLVQSKTDGKINVNS